MQIKIIIKHLNKTNEKVGRFCIATAIISPFAMYLLRPPPKFGYNYSALNINTKLKILNLMQFDCVADRNCYNRFFQNTAPKLQSSASLLSTQLHRQKKPKQERLCSEDQDGVGKSTRMNKPVQRSRNFYIALAHQSKNLLYRNESR